MSTPVRHRRRVLLVVVVLLAACAEPPPSWEVKAAAVPRDRAATPAVQPALGPPLEAIQRWRAVELWNATTTWDQAVVDIAKQLTLEAEGNPRPTGMSRAYKSPATTTGRCGGDLPPCWVMMRESGGNIHAYNPTGCGGRGCYGKWQCDPRSCDGTGTEAEQDAEARRLWDHGRGCSHWAAC